MKVGLIGAGKMGQHHARAMSVLKERCSLAAVVDPSEEARAKVLEIWPGAHGFSTVDEMLRARLTQVVHVCTSPATHRQLTKSALEAGQHVYVEKPFVETVNEAEELLALAGSLGLKVCAGHQLLFEKPTLDALQVLPALREIAHIESYFAFKTVRRAPGGRVPLAPQLQLLDILPHPVYLLLRFLDAAAPGGTAELTAVDIGPAGTVHAQVRQGAVTASLIVTLEGRPVDSYLKVVGSNGTVIADYVRGTTQRMIGPGVSGIDKAFNPYRISRQLAFGTTSALFARVTRKQKSYPGLAELFLAFYESIQQGKPSPTPPDSIRATVAICERVAKALEHGPRAAAAPAARLLGRTSVLVTGGTGFLGRRLCQELVDLGAQVRVVARREPAPWEGLAGVEYVAGDLSQPLPQGVFAGVDAVVHCAAETAGGWEEHERNSVKATESVLQGAAAAGIKRFVHVSSIAVLANPSGRTAVSEASPLHADPKSAGPYTWGKLVSEQRAAELGAQLGVGVKVFRPAALVDYERFDPPGKLGKRVGNIFVAVGSRGEPLAATDLAYNARMIAWAALDFDSAPAVLNIFAPAMPTRSELVERLRASNPDLTVVWLPRLILNPLSWAAILAQKLLRPGKPAISVAKVFAPQRYDNSAAVKLASVADAWRERRLSSSGTTKPRTPEVVGVGDGAAARSP